MSSTDLAPGALKAPVANFQTKTTLRILWSVLLAFLFSSLSVTDVFSGSEEWETIVPGVAYREFTLTDPNQVYVARMERSNPDLIIDTSVAQGSILYGMETVSGMASRFDQSLSSWGGTWTARNRVVVAINGSFFDLETGQPETGLIQSGWYAKRFEDLWGGSGLGWTQNREIFLGECVDHDPSKQHIQVPEDELRISIDGINVQRQPDTLIIYTPQYDHRTHTSDTGVEIIVEMSRPLGIPEEAELISGRVVDIRENLGSTSIAFDQVVLSARGEPMEMLLEHVQIDEVLTFHLDITHYKRDCEQRNGDEWKGIYASVGGSFDFLRDQEILRFDDDRGATQRNPRTAICYNAEYLFFIVVDGRDPGRSRGMTILELGYFCRDKLGADWGINQDGGGSSAIWVNGEIKNQPSDGKERPVSNGWMIIQLQPNEYSSAFFPGNLIKTHEITEVHLGPGSNFPILGSIAPQIQGVLIPDSHQLDGVLATHSYWWKVAFADVVGWVRQEDFNKPRSWHGFLLHNPWLPFP
jgi:hypothetical protein